MASGGEIFNQDWNNEHFVDRGKNGNEYMGHDDTGYSLDGKSLIVPDYGDIDDMSSLGTSKYTYRGDGGNAVGYIGDMKIIGKADDYESDPSTMSSLEKKLSAHYTGDPESQNEDYDLQLYKKTQTTAGENEGKMSQASQKKKHEKEASKSCVPRWIAESPLWLKLVIICSIALLLGALVLIAVGAQLSSDEQAVPSSQEKNSVDDVDTPIETDPLTEYINEPDMSVTMSPVFAPVDVTKSPVETVSTSEVEVPTNTDTWGDVTTIYPTTLAVEFLTKFPSSFPTTAFPTDFPSDTSTTSSPTASPSFPPTNAPSTKPPISVPSESPTTSRPTPSPSKTPTQNPTQSPTSSVVNFFVMGGRFDGEDTKTLENGLQSLPQIDSSTVLIHLGDWNSPYATSCDEDSFISNVETYRQSSVPVYFVPGDNEYNDCPNPTVALGLWDQYLLDFETKYWQNPSWEIIRQSPDYDENFAFLQRKVLFVGINLVGGIVHDKEEWDARHDANLLWIDATAAKYDGRYTTMVIFAHADPDIEINEQFFTDFYPMVERYDEQVIFVHRNLGIDTWKKESGYNGISNLEVVSVEGSKWPPMLVQIDGTNGNYAIDQSSWYDDFTQKGKLPKSP